jgi:hypothetical protein
MMSVLDSVMPRGRSLVVSPGASEQASGIAAKIADAERQLTALCDDERPDVALAAENGHRGATARLAEIDAEAATLERRLSQLRAAHTAAVVADKRMLEQRQSALRAQQIAMVQSHLAKRDAAAARFTTAIQQAIHGYLDLLESAHQAILANGEGAFWPAGNRCEPAVLRMLTESEIWRLGAAARFPSRAFAANPASMRPMAEQLQASTRFTIGELKSPPLNRPRPAAPVAGPAPVPETAPMAV